MYFEKNMAEKKVLDGNVLRCLELYSGIGGMHYGFRETSIPHRVVAAIDINTTANAAYRYNFPETNHLQRNIQSLTLEEFEYFAADVITLSPPCQPFTRIGLKRDANDARTESLFYFLKLLPRIKNVSYILVENVCGFETSETRDKLIEILKESGFSFQEFSLSPSQLGIPNSRLRYYLLAKRKPLKFCFNTDENIILTDFSRNGCKCIQNLTYPLLIGDYLENEVSDKYLLPSKVLERFSNILDIVSKLSNHSCCFTKGYSHYVEGTGSVLHQNDNYKVCDIYEEAKNLEGEAKVNVLKKLNLRYFTPREIANLMGFPPINSTESFSFPESMTEKQKYRLLGNSVNVKVIGQLLRTLLCNEWQK